MQIYAKARAKLKALARIFPLINIQKSKVMMKAFVTAQFNWYLLIWMFHSTKLNNKINRLHKRCLQIVYSDNRLSILELLETDKSVSVHHLNIQWEYNLGYKKWKKDSFDGYKIGYFSLWNTVPSGTWILVACSALN